MIFSKIPLSKEPERNLYRSTHIYIGNKNRGLKGLGAESSE
jgi:hypothetical protein